MSKLKELWLRQGHKTYTFAGSIDLEFNKKIIVCGPNKPSKPDKAWDVTIEVQDIWAVFKAWEKNRIFRLHVEYTSKSNGKINLEVVDGKLIILDIIKDKKNLGMSGGYIMHGFSPDLNVKDDNEKEVVQFD